jgi:hypothetical protein
LANSAQVFEPLYEQAGVEFVDENGREPGVRLCKLTGQKE